MTSLPRPRGLVVVACAVALSSCMNPSISIGFIQEDGAPDQGAGEGGQPCAGAGQGSEGTAGGQAGAGGEGVGGSGAGGASPGTQWIKSFGGQYQDAYAIAADSSGNVVVTGCLHGTLDFGDGYILSSSEEEPYQIYVVKLSGDGAVIWARSFPSANSAYGLAAAIDSSGNIVIAGAFEASLDLGGGSLTSAGSSDAFVLKLDPQGELLWAKRFGNNTPQSASGVAVDSAGNVTVIGHTFMTTPWWKNGELDFGGGPLTSVGEHDIFLVKLDASGDHLWSKIMGSHDSEVAHEIAVDAADNIVLTGCYENILDLGGGWLMGEGGMNAFVAKLSPSGDHVWSRHFEATGRDHGTSVGVDKSGDIVVAGTFEETMYMEDGVRTAEGMIDAFVVKLDPSGATLWSRRYGGTPADIATPGGVAFDADDNIALVGNFIGAIDFGGGPFVSDGFSQDTFVMKLDPAGAYLAGRVGAGPQDQVTTGVVLDAAGAPIVAGWFTESLDYGVAPVVTTLGNQNLFVAKLAF